MKRLFVLSVAALLLAPLMSSEADARWGGGGGGGDSVAAEDLLAEAFAAAVFPVVDSAAALQAADSAARRLAALAAPDGRVPASAVLAGAWFVQASSWIGCWARWVGTSRLGSRRLGQARLGRGRWPVWGAAAGLGIAAGPYYGGYYPYGYGYNAYDDCPTIQQRVWDGWGYRIVWVSSCDDY